MRTAPVPPPPAAQAYCLSKVQPLPLDVEFDLSDTLHALRPKLQLFAGYQDALDAVQGILAEEAAAGGGGALGVIGGECFHVVLCVV